jgi:ferric-dicitrate binding protein FerR (iron transport regulator)
MEKKETYSKNDELLVKYLTGMANESEREQALAWIRDNMENRKYYDQLKEIYEATKIAQPSSVYDTNMSWEKVKSLYYKRRIKKLETEDKENRLFFIKETVKYAALIIAIVTLGILGFRLLSFKSIINSTQVWNEVEAPFGSRTVVNLADGSKVWLNAGSKLKYAANFAESNREVILTGEAYFDVNKYREMQFIVKTSHLNVKVLGTEFNVKAYPEENTIQTTLVRGSITIEGTSKYNKMNADISLKPNQSFTYIKDINIFEKAQDRSNAPDEKKVQYNQNMVLLHKIDPAIYTSWKDNRWFIEGETLLSLAIKLERRYNVKIEFNSESLKFYKFSGTLRDETLEQVLNLMQFSAPIEYKIKENNVYLSDNKSFKKSYDEMLINR